MLPLSEGSLLLFILTIRGTIIEIHNTHGVICYPATLRMRDGPWRRGHANYYRCLLVILKFLVI